MMKSSFQQIFREIAAEKFTVAGNIHSLFQAFGQLVGGVCASVVEGIVAAFYALDTCCKYELECNIRIAGSICGAYFNSW